MAKIGVICPAATGHLNPLFTLGKELERRGHQLYFYQPLDTKAKVAGFAFRAIGETVFPAGALIKEIQRIGALAGKEAFRESVRLIRKNTEINLGEVPALAKADGIEFFLAFRNLELHHR